MTTYTQKFFITADPATVDPATVPSLDDVSREGVAAGMAVCTAHHVRGQMSAFGRYFASLLQYPNALELCNQFYADAFHKVYGNISSEAKLSEQPRWKEWRTLTNRMQDECRKKGMKYDPFRTVADGIGLTLRKLPKKTAADTAETVAEHTQRTAGDGREWSAERLQELVSLAIQSGQVKPHEALQATLNACHKTQRGRASAAARLAKDNPQPIRKAS